MKKLLLLLLVSNSFLMAQVNTVVSILPQKTFVEKIGGDKVNVSVMVLPGNSPHSYEPKPSQMKDIAKADLYFSIGIEFEYAWLNKFTALNSSMKIIKTEQNIKKIEMEEHSHGDDEEHAHHDHGGKTLDPHVWTTPSNVKIIAKNIYNALSSSDPSNTKYYKENYEIFLQEINKLDKEINNILLASDDMAKFVVFHPSWGYFAKDYRLTQVALEVGGKNPTIKHMQKVIKSIKENYIEVILTAPEFSDKAAKQIASETGIKVVKISPLNPKWEQNLLNLAKAIANK
jgi:zinc transport system substrate-binding protein